MNMIHPETGKITIEQLASRLNALESADNRYAQRGGSAITYDANGRIQYLNATYINAGTIDASVITVSNINASNISTGTLSANRIGANTITGSHIAANAIGADEIEANAVTADKIAADSVTANKIDVATLSAISANLGTITAGSITGVTVASSSGNDKIVLDNGDSIDFYNGGSLVCQIISNGAGISLTSDLYALGGITTNATTGAPANDGIFTATLHVGSKIIFGTRSSNATDNWALYMYDNGGYGLRSRMDGGTWQVDQTAV